MFSDEITQKLKGEQILVTGGCGFLGSQVTKQLSNIGAKVTVLDNLSSGKKSYIEGLDGIEFVKGEITDTNLINSVVKNKKYIIHLAALPFIPDSYYYPVEFFQVNANATISLAMAAIKEKKIERFVYISSSEVYGNAEYTPMDEKHPTVPQSTYAVSKLAGDKVIYTIHKEHDFPAVIIRPFNLYGPNITQPYIIPEIISQMINSNGEIKLGNINTKRDFTFVSDTARAIILSLTKDGICGETLNVGSGKSYMMKEIVEMISDLLSKKVKIVTDSSRFRPFDVDDLVCDYQKAAKLLEWNPTVGIKEGLEITVNWALKNDIKFKSAFKGWTSVYRNGSGDD